MVKNQISYLDFNDNSNYQPYEIQALPPSFSQGFFTPPVAQNQAYSSAGNASSQQYKPYQSSVYEIPFSEVFPYQRYLPSPYHADVSASVRSITNDNTSHSDTINQTRANEYAPPTQLEVNIPPVV